MFIRALKTFDADAAGLDDLVELSAIARLLQGEFEAERAEVPEWLTTARRTLSRRIGDLQADARAARRADITRQLDTLKTPAQKRRELEKELATLGEPA